MIVPNPIKYQRQSMPLCRLQQLKCKYIWFSNDRLRAIKTLSSGHLTSVQTKQASPLIKLWKSYVSAMEGRG
jgi:hypothetical protein